MRVALTIDAEERGLAAAGTAAAILDALAVQGVRASFFVQGRWARACPELARRIRDEGHLIGSHGYYHAPLDLLTDEGVRRTVERATQVILEVAGVDPRPWFRCPYGGGAGDPRVLALLEAMGYRDVGWDVDPGDWADGRCAQDVLTAVVDGCVAHGDGARVLLHSWPGVTAAALPQVIAALRSARVGFIGLDELDA